MKNKEPLFHIVKRDDLPWHKVWGIRLIAILIIVDLIVAIVRIFVFIFIFIFVFIFVFVFIFIFVFIFVLVFILILIFSLAGGNISIVIAASGYELVCTESAGSKYKNNDGRDQGYQ